MQFSINSFDLHDDGRKGTLREGHCDLLRYVHFPGCFFFSMFSSGMGVLQTEVVCKWLSQDPRC